MIKKVTLQERGQIMDIGILGQADSPFSSWIKIIQIGTDLEDEAINELTNDEIIELGTEVLTSISKKKQMTHFFGSMFNSL